LDYYVLLQLADSAKNADATEFMQVIRQTEDMLEANRRNKCIAGGIVSNGLLDIHDLENLVVIGDLHGDCKSLFRILCKIDYRQFLSKRLNKLVFLGDYIDRGTDSISIMYSVCYLKSEYPDSVILMRGNHEAPAEFPFSPHNFPYEIKKRYGNSWSEIYVRILSVFKKLTIATMVKQKLLFVHGGLPTQGLVASNFRESIIYAHENQARNSVLEEILWNDPRQIPENKGYERSSRGLGRYFGPSITRNWLQATGVKAIIRGHEPCQGFKLDHDNKILTLFSCRDVYPNSSAAYLELDAATLDTMKDAKDLSVRVKLLE
jgi:diadenosine tetraphosphatase ApaH/serine/threonine PP2A family protein phosphatase